jgi:hypothetical protein
MTVKLVYVHRTEKYIKSYQMDEQKKMIFFMPKENF